MCGQSNHPHPRSLFQTFVDQVIFKSIPTGTSVIIIVGYQDPEGALAQQGYRCRQKLLLFFCVSCFC